MAAKMRRWMTALLLVSLFFPIGLLSRDARAAERQVIAQYDFEDGTGRLANKSASTSGGRMLNSRARCSHGMT